MLNRKHGCRSRVAKNFVGNLSALIPVMAPLLSKTFSLDQIPDLVGKVMIVTGGATGIGRQTVLALLKHNAKVYIASRSQSKFDAMLAALEEEQKPRLKFLPLDLSSLKACVDAAENFGRAEERCDVLVANAALSIMPCDLTVDGYEIQFATNHLGHFAFISHLLPLIKKTSTEYGEARVIIVASHAHSMYKADPKTGIDFNDLTVSKQQDMTKVSDIQPSLQRYARSKLANIQYARALHRRLEKEGFNRIFVNCLNPGTIGSPTFGSSPAPHLPSWIKILSQGIIRMTSISPADGALTSLMLATDPEIAEKEIKGRYFDVGPLAGKFVYGYSYEAEEKLSGFARDGGMGERLWEWSERALGKVLGGK
ncbi:putative carbonyl reductase [Halenospora varia]|nr:putative carbonyl reductase [Halenospora varia]